MAKVKWGGVTLDSRTAKQMNEVVKRTGLKPRAVQGSYSRGVNSAGTHSGGGAIDLDVSHFTAKQKYNFVKQMRVVGMAAWLRPYRPGVWGEHIHAISIGAPGLAYEAKRQVEKYKKGQDGLAGTNRDPHRSMNVSFRTWEQYLKAKSNLTYIKRVRYGNAGGDVKVLRDRLRKFIAKHESWALVRKLDPNPNWNRKGGVLFDKNMSKLMWQAHKTLARITRNKGWTNLRNDVPGNSLLTRLGLRAY